MAYQKKVMEVLFIILNIKLLLETICGSEFYLAPEILKSKYRRRNKIIINCFKIKQ